MHKHSPSTLLFTLFCTLFAAFVAVGNLQSQPAIAAPLSQFDSPLPTPPANDNFAQAQVINTLPFETHLDLTDATAEADEPHPNCNYEPISRTVWYQYTPIVDQTVMFRASGYAPILAIYQGSSLSSLQLLYCATYGSQSALFMQAGQTYFFQLGEMYETYGYNTSLYLDVAPNPEVNFYYYPNNPSKYDMVGFQDSTYDPADQSFASSYWDFGDGTTSDQYYASHQYVADGEYTVYHAITTVDGRSGSNTQVVTVRTVDVAITRFARPRQAVVGQTKRLIINVTNSSYPTDVQVELYKSVPGGYDYIGFLKQFVDAKPRGQTTKFYLSYTFTEADAAMGKVIFKARAFPVNDNDAFPADNEFITFATTVKHARGGNRIAGTTSAADLVQSAALDDYSGYNTDTVSNVNATFEEVGNGTVEGVVEDQATDGTSDGTIDGAIGAVEGTPAATNQNFKTYLPLISAE